MRRPNINKILRTFEIADAQLMQPDVMIVSWNYFWKPEKDDRNPILLQTIPYQWKRFIIFQFKMQTTDHSSVDKLEECYCFNRRNNREIRL
jgi:hypothetical protein